MLGWCTRLRRRWKGFVLHVTGNFPEPLSAQEESDYIKRLKNGDIDARNVLIERNLRLVAHVVKKYSGAIEHDDLISIGTIGLIKGITSFNPEKNIRLATYVAKCVENEVLMALRHDKKFACQVSLYEPLGFDGDGNEVSLMEVLQSEDEDICENLDRATCLSRLYEKIKSVLEKRERQVLQMRYGLVDGQSLTQREVAKTLGISRSYVSRIEKRAIKKLRDTK